MRIKHQAKFSLLSFSSLGFLGIFAVALLCPTADGLSQSARAAEGDIPASAGGNSLSIAISNSKINLTTDPTIENGIVQSALQISAKTTNETGYTLKISTPSATTMRSTDSAVSATIATLASNSTLANFPDNRWGYYIGDAVATASSAFRPFSTTAADVDTTTVANSTLRNKMLTIAAKVGTSLPASTYTGNVAISVVTNPPKVSFGTITTMQEMTSSVCSGIATGTEGTLTDTRDGNIYHVGKMLDGKCWMLQNLALGSTTGTISLTSSNSNVTSNWTLPKAYTSATSGDKSDYNVKQLWNFGKWVLATPLLTTSCGSSGTINNPAACIKVGFVDVSDSTKFEPTFTAKTMAWNGANSNSSTLVAVNCTSWSGSGTSKTCAAGTYDAHYLIGNYYSWGVATAASGDGISSGNASSSICPKGWKLPTRGTSAGSFGGLLSKYGVSSSVSGSNYNIAGAPLSFVRSGYVYPGNRVNYAGQYGYYWSSTASNSDVAYYLGFNDSSVNPSNDNYRYGGRAVRCIAQ